MKGAWLKAILLLPFNVTVIIPILLLWYTDYQWCIPAKSQIILGVILFCGGLGLFIKTTLLFHKAGQGTISPLAPPKRLIIKRIFVLLYQIFITSLSYSSYPYFFHDNHPSFAFVLPYSSYCPKVEPSIPSSLLDSKSAPANKS